MSYTLCNDAWSNYTRGMRPYNPKLINPYTASKESILSQRELNRVSSIARSVANHWVN